MNNLKVITVLNSVTLFCFLIIFPACNSNADKPSISIVGESEVKIGRLICGGHLPLAIVEKKFQKDFTSFHLKTIQFHDWKNLSKDLQSGKLAGTFILSPLAMNMIREGLPAKIVLKADRNGNGFVLSDKINSIDDLKGRKTIMAVPHKYSQHNVLLHLALKQNNIPIDKVKIIARPPRDMITSLERGEIDGFVVGEPEAHKSISLGVGWMARISPQIWKDHIDHVFIASDRFIKEHPDQLQELINALVEAGQFIENNPGESSVLGEDYTGSSASVFEKVLTTPPDWIDYSDMVPSKNDIEAMSAKLVDMGLWESMPEDLAIFTDLRFVNSTIKK